MKIVNLKVANQIENPIANPGLGNNTFMPQASLVIALGCFDGVHVGHRALLNSAIEDAKKNNFVSAALIISRSIKNSISTLERRISVMKDIGIDMVIIEDFEAIRNMSKEEYVTRLVFGLNCKIAVCGYNFSFGKGKSGSSHDLLRLMSSHSCDARIIEKVKVYGLAVSSSEIRSFLMAGDIAKANLLLGRPYSIEGEILHGMALGRNLGFPTINQALCVECTHPKCGVYGGFTVINGVKYKSVTNIGVKPTVLQGSEPTAETHIIDFTGDVYGKNAAVNLLYRIRDEKTFENMDELKKEVLSNIETVKNHPIIM